jgi:hypothetical protein
VKIILSIPLVPDMKDFVAWHYDKNGPLQCEINL